MQSASLLQAPDGTFAVSAQQLSAQQQQVLAKSLSAMLCARAGIGNSAADPLLANSRSNSPNMRPRDASTTSAGSLDSACMQLPPAALPMQQQGAGSCLVRPSPLGRPQQQQQHNDNDSCACHSGQNQTLDGRAPAQTHDTPVSLFKACRLGDPCCYGSPSTHSQEPALEPPAFTVEEPAYIRAPAPAASAPAAPAPVRSAPAQHQQQQAASVSHAAADDDDAADNVEVQAPAVQQSSRRPCVLNSPKAWLYELVSCPFLFKPCPQCSATNTGREVLITYFDTDNPTHGFCTYCPQRHSRPHLLQIRRSTYHEVVKATDVSRLTDVTGIQHYVINGAKVLFLRPRPQPRPPKGVVAPARCAVDGRQLMDAHSSYCSLRCKLEVEDVVFAANFPSAAEEMQLAAAAAAAAAGGADSSSGALAGAYYKQGGHEGRRVVVPNQKRQTPQPQAAAAAAAHSQDTGLYDSSEDAGDAAEGGWGARHKRHRNMPSKFANAVVGGSYQVAVGGSNRPPGLLNRGAHQNSIKMRDDTVCDQAAAAYATFAGGAPAGLAGLHLLHKGAAGEAGSRHHADSPCGSDDSGRSTTFSQRKDKRKRAPPSRSAMQ